ncbi:tautomerase family protein [Bacillus sonorensis]|uniref:tautomerase family protein n=1 Tax=Bacillus sonorensis TaxID=119858 RepID=UPI002DB8DFEE|nr:tautomerase family protein [Bacillus sonorensis]MEC1537926.1 tautomerase family protein [Bacillus sonorensis]
MPYVRIDLLKGRTKEELRTISRSVHQAMTETIDVPEDDYFQVITQHDEEEFFFDPGYVNINRTKDLIYIQITMKQRRTQEKTALYRRIAERLHRGSGVRMEDVMIIVTENTEENWSFGNGIAQLASTTGEGAE